MGQGSCGESVLVSCPISWLTSFLIAVVGFTAFELAEGRDSCSPFSNSGTCSFLLLFARRSEQRGLRLGALEEAAAPSMPGSQGPSPWSSTFPEEAERSEEASGVFAWVSGASSFGASSGTVRLKPGGGDGRMPPSSAPVPASLAMRCKDLTLEVSLFSLPSFSPPSSESDGAGQLGGHTDTSEGGQTPLRMPPAGRKRLGRKAPAEPQRMAACDSGGGGSRELSGPEAAAAEGNNPVADKHGRKRSSPGPREEDVGNEIQEMLQGLGVGIKQALLAKRKMFEANAKASLKTTNEKIEQGWKIQQEQRQNLHFKYSQQFLTLLWEWDTDMRKAQEQEAKLAGMFQEQQKILQQARIVQNQRLEKLRNVYKEFLKRSQALDKDHEHFLTDEQSEVREEITKLQNKIMREAQQQELAMVRKSLHSLLF
uniref:XLR/SYCP3/FAM9 domain-containing protein n=2 Tax=Canis lupus familiaris TaxID=9615 RepID=A0A8C0RKZ0_CANLF